MSKIAILGATGHIAKGLIDNLSKGHKLSLYSRSMANPPEYFYYDDNDIIINCIGVREKLWTDSFQIFRITEIWDDYCIEYVRKHTGALYIAFSSGAVFGQGFEKPVDASTMATIDVNGMNGSSTTAFYGIAKFNSEAKHRALSMLNIVDIRVFSYFSRYMHPDDLSIMNEILTCVREGRELATSPADFYRDYIHPKDLALLVEKCIEIHNVNDVFDAYSRRPISKFELLDHFVEHYGLKYRIDENFPETSPTGPKPHYYSENGKAFEIGYVPRYSSYDCIAEETEKLLLTAKNAKSTERI